MKEDAIFKTLGIAFLAGMALYTVLLGFRIYKLESDVRERLEGKAYCGVCRKYEDIASVDMINGRGLFDTVATFSVKTHRHIQKKTGNCKSFDAFGTVSWFRLQRLEVGIHPGCNFTCRGCDKWGWRENWNKTTPR